MITALFIRSIFDTDEAQQFFTGETLSDIPCSVKYEAMNEEFHIHHLVVYEDLW